MSLGFASAGPPVILVGLCFASFGEYVFGAFLSSEYPWRSVSTQKLLSSLWVVLFCLLLLKSECADFRDRGIGDDNGVL